MKRKVNVEKQSIIIIAYGSSNRMISYSCFDMTPRRCKKLRKKLGLVKQNAHTVLRGIRGYRPCLYITDDIIKETKND